MTRLQVVVLGRAAQVAGPYHSEGTSLDIETKGGCLRQVKWLLAQRLIRKFRGRLIATRMGRRVLKHQRGQ
jgi:hypothetical protein